MDNQRLIIWSFFGFMCFLTYQAWVLDGAQDEAYTQRPAQIQNNIIENNIEQSSIILDQAPSIQDTFSGSDE